MARYRARKAKLYESNPEQCHRAAQVFLRDQYLCNQHAGALALKIVLGEIE